MATTDTSLTPAQRASIIIARNHIKTTATTVRGMLNALRANLRRDTRPLATRGGRYLHGERSAAAVVSRAMQRRADRLANYLGLPTREQHEFTMRSAASAQCAALGLWALDDSDDAAKSVTAAVCGNLPHGTIEQARQSVAVVAALSARHCTLDAAIAAKLIGESYHVNVLNIYKSQRASVVYGAGAQYDYDYPYAGDHKNRRAEWHNAGARWEVDGTKLILVIEDSAGKERARVTMPRSLRGLGTDGLTHGDLFSLTRRERVDGAMRNVATRYNEVGKITGVAVDLPSVGRPGTYWEHGVSVSACVAERAHKQAIHDAAIVANRATAKQQRRERLLARLATRISVTREDARATGACMAGINAWCERMGIASSTNAVSSAEIVRLAKQSNEPRAIAAALIATRRALQSSRAS